MPLPPIPDTLDAWVFRASVDSDRTLWTEDAVSRPTGQWSARTAASYVHAPLVYHPPAGDDVRLVGDVLAVDAAVGWTWRRLRLGADVPVLLRTTSDVYGAQTGFGDAAVDVRGLLVDAARHPIGFAVDGRAYLPSATVDAPLGTGHVGGEVSMIGEGRLGPAGLVADVGWRREATAYLPNATLRDRMILRGAATFAIGRGGLDLEGAAAPTWGEPLTNEAANPIEALAGGWFDVGALRVQAAVGAGLDHGIGASRGRAILAVTGRLPRKASPSR